MIHRTFDQVKGTSNFVEADGFVSARLAVADDNLGFTVTEAIGVVNIGQKMAFGQRPLGCD